MNRKFVIADGVIENVIVADDDFILPGKTVVPATDVGGPGWLWLDGEAIDPTPIPTLEELRATKLAELDHQRWLAEIGGMDFAGMRVRTDENSLNKMTAAYISAALDPSYSIPNWEVAPGTFVALDNATIIALGAAAREHVQATFDRKAELARAISSATSELELLSLNEGWP